jgi:hypothetical protein
VGTFLTAFFSNAVLRGLFYSAFGYYTYLK